MKNQNTKNYSFCNDVLIYQSHINDFSCEIFEEFNLKSEKLDLTTKIKDLMNGDIVNFSENQSALHPLYRQKKKDNNRLSRSSLSALQTKIKSKNILNPNIVVLGIGGSYEGPKLLLESLGLNGSDDLDFNFQFITGSDQNEFLHKTKSLDPKDTIFIVSSKSFTTDETVESLKQALKWSIDTSYFIAITSNVNEALKYGLQEDAIIDFYKEVGGRYSIWSPIAEFIISKSSFNSFLDGGRKADEDLLNFDTDNKYFNFVKYLAFSDIWLNNSQGKKIRAVLSYAWKLRSFPDYVQQLEMESLGKPANLNSDFKNTGQVIFGGYGPIAQHSYFQLLHQGTQEFCADIVANSEDSRSLAFAQAITQSELLSYGDDHFKEVERINGNTPLNLFLLRKIDPLTLGYLIATWEHRTFISAVMLQINPFDQFGVNAGKVHTKKYLAGKD